LRPEPAASGDHPLTRENYLELAYWDDVPKVLSWEQEMDLPPQFRRKAPPCPQQD
jgi:hypothetical protein